MPRLSIIGVIALLILQAACTAANRGGQLATSWNSYEVAAELPAVGQLDALARRVSATAEDWGWVIEHSAGAEFVFHPGWGDETWRLIGNDSSPEWLIYAAGPEWSIGAVPEQFIRMEAAQEVDEIQGSWYAVADFASGTWRWQPTTHLNPESTNWEYYDMAGVIDPVSPDGYAYAVVAVLGAGVVAWPSDHCKFFYDDPAQ